MDADEPGIVSDILKVIILVICSVGLVTAGYELVQFLIKSLGGN